MPVYNGDPKTLKTQELLTYVSYLEDPLETADEFNKLIYRIFGFDPQYTGDINIQKREYKSDIEVRSVSMYQPAFDGGYLKIVVLCSCGGAEKRFEYTSRSSNYIACILSALYVED